MADMKELFSRLDDILSDVDLSDITQDSAGFEALPDGYYLCEVENTELKESKSSHNPMVAFTFKICENGIVPTVNDNGNNEFIQLSKTKNRKIFMYFVLKDERSIKRFASDMLKFEDSYGDPILPKEAFMSSDTILDALDCLVGMRLYINVSTSENDDGTKSQWNNLISWKRANIMELPI